MLDLPEPAPWLLDLPRDQRGFPIPAEAGWIDGTGVLSRVDTDRKFVLGVNRACAVCGFAIQRGELGFRAFAQGDAAQIRGYERDRSHDLAGPTHRSCIMYSAMVCPYLRERTARLGKDSDISPGARRGTLAAVMGFTDFGLLMPVGQAATSATPHFAYVGLTVDLPYRHGSELADDYRASTESDHDQIDVGARRFYWSDEPASASELARELKASMRHIQTLQPQYETAVQNVGPLLAVFP